MAEPLHGGDEPPPVGKRWGVLYAVVLGALLLSALSLDLGPRLEFVRRVVELVALVRLVLLIARAPTAPTRSLVAAREP